MLAKLLTLPWGMNLVTQSENNWVFLFFEFFIMMKIYKTKLTILTIFKHAVASKL